MPSGFSVHAYVWPSGALTTFGSRTLTGPPMRVHPVQARLGEVEGHVRLVEQHLEAGVAVAGGLRHHRHVELVVRQVRLVAAQVDVEPAGPGDRPGRPVRGGLLGGEHPDADGPGQEDVVAPDQPSRSGSRLRTSAMASRARPVQPAGTSSLSPPTRLNM